MLAGFIAFFIARGTRSHDFERERRRRKQDCLERAIEDFDQFYYALQWLASASMAFAEVRMAEVKQLVHEEVVAAIRKEEVARVGFCRNRSKLLIFGFERCAVALTHYEAEALMMKTALLRLRQGEKIDFQHLVADAEVKAHELREAVAVELKRL